MKFPTTFAIVAAASAQDDKKVPPRHPLQRLNRLTVISRDILVIHFDWLASKEAWIKKFKRNSDRMARNFKRGEQRCGYYDGTQLPHGGPEGKFFVFQGK